MPYQDETLVAFGGELKTLDHKGRVGGYLTLWGDPDATDLTGDFFTPETDLGRFVKSGMGLYYVHGLPRIAGQPNPLEGREIGEAEFKSDDVGLFMEGQLALRDKYEAKVWELARKKKLGLSGGAVSHLVRREKQPNGSYKMLRFPLAEASLTPIPAEPRTNVVALKSLADGLEVKGMALGADAEPSAAMGAVDRLADMARYRCSEHMRDQKLSPADKMAACRACLDEFAATSARVIEALLAGGDEAAAKSLIESFGSGDSPETFLDTALRTASDLERSARRFPKLGTSKRSAIKTLRDSLDGLLRVGGPDIEAERHRVDDLMSRLSK